MQACKYASILSPKFSTKIFPGLNFFKPSEPGGLRIFRAFASLFLNGGLVKTHPTEYKMSFCENENDDGIFIPITANFMICYW